MPMSGSRDRDREVKFPPADNFTCDQEQPVGEYPELPPELFVMQRILLGLKWDRTGYPFTLGEKSL